MRLASHTYAWPHYRYEKVSHNIHAYAWLGLWHRTQLKFHKKTSPTFTILVDKVVVEGIVTWLSGDDYMTFAEANTEQLFSPDEDEIDDGKDSKGYGRGHAALILASRPTPSKWCRCTLHPTHIPKHMCTEELLVRSMYMYMHIYSPGKNYLTYTGQFSWSKIFMNHFTNSMVHVLHAWIIIYNVNDIFAISKNYFVKFVTVKVSQYTVAWAWPVTWFAMILDLYSVFSQ